MNSDYLVRTYGLYVFSKVRIKNVIPNKNDISTSCFYKQVQNKQDFNKQEKYIITITIGAKKRFNKIKSNIDKKLANGCDELSFNLLRLPLNDVVTSFCSSLAPIQIYNYIIYNHYHFILFIS